MHFIKKFLKSIFILLIIALIGFCGYRYYTLKKDGKLEEVFAKDDSYVQDSYYGKDYSQATSTSSQETKNENDKNKQEISGEKYVVEEKNYDGYYNQFNFDNRVLLYEGKQLAQASREAFDFLIQDAEDPLYSKPTIIFKNFAGLSSNEITANDLVEYKLVLEKAKNSIGNSSCVFEFEYNKLKTYVNKIIITKQ